MVTAQWIHGPDEVIQFVKNCVFRGGGGTYFFPFFRKLILFAKTSVAIVLTRWYTSFALRWCLSDERVTRIASPNGPTVVRRFVGNLVNREGIIAESQNKEQELANTQRANGKTLGFIFGTTFCSPWRIVASR